MLHVVEIERVLRFQDGLVHQSNESGPNSPGLAGNRFDIDAALALRHVNPAVECSLRPRLQRIGIVREKVGRARKPGNKAWTQFLLHERHRLSDAYASELRIVVVRVVPCLDTQRLEVLAGDAMHNVARHIKKWSMPRRVAWRHGRYRPGSRSARQPQEDGLGLIFSGVGKKYLINAALRRHVRERGPAGCAGRRLWSTLGTDLHTFDHDLVDSPLPDDVPGIVRNAGRIRLESVVDDDHVHLVAHARQCPGRAGDQRERIRPARASDDHGGDFDAVDDRAPQTLSLWAHVCHAAAPRIRSSHSDGSRISPRVGTLPGSAHTRFIAGMPPSFTTARTKAAPSRY